MQPTAGTGSDSDRIVRLGAPCRTTAVKDSVLGSRNGRPVLWLAVEGSALDPSWLVCVDAESGTICDSRPIDAMTGPKAVCQSADGSVFIGGYHTGALFRQPPGEAGLEEIGLPFPDTEFIFALEPGAEPDEVLGGTWPDGAAFRWSPDRGFQPLGKHPVRPGAQWLRCIARDAETGAILLGSGTPQRWTVISNGLHAAPPAVEDPAQSFGYQAVAGGGVAVLLGILNSTVVRLTAGGQVQPWYRIEGTDPHRPVLLDPGRGEVIIWHADGSLCRHRPSGCRRLDAAGFSPAALNDDGAGTVLIAGTTGLARIPVDGGPAVVLPYDRPLPQTRQAVSALAVGPDRRIYAGGFLNGGIGRLDPAGGPDSGITRLEPISQPEVIGRWAEDLLVGSYPKARVRLIAGSDLAADRLSDPAGTVDEITFAGDGQDRPYAFAAADDRVGYCGFMADYGLLPGGLVRLERDPAAPAGTRLRAGPMQFPVGDRSIIGLFFDPGRRLWATTTVYGGMGVAPTQSEAVLLVTDPDGRRAGSLSTAPVPVPALYGGGFARGRFWLLADTRLYGVGIERGDWREIELGLEVPPLTPDVRHAHQAAVRVVADDRLVVALTGVGLVEVRLDLNGWAAAPARVVWAGAARHPVVSTDGIYFVDAATLELCRWQTDE